LVQGVPMSRLTGLGGLTNAELQKTAGSSPTVYRARLFVRQTWGVGGEREAVASDQNQLAGTRDKNRVVLSVGKLAVSDIFDANAYAHDPRTQFMNWSFLTHGAYDFAADSRGYSVGAALEYYRDDWAVRAGRFMLPRESNGLALDRSLSRHHGDQFELEKGYVLAGQPGKARLLLFRNRAVMGGFDDALAVAAGRVPDVALVRQLRVKRGWGINLEQSLGDSAGLFARVGRSDGASEAYAFAEIDRSLSLGLNIKGAGWGRAQDTLGLAYARNGLSASHQKFLAAGGNGFFVGDGRLNYRPESITEGYYSLGLDVLKRTAISLGAQYIRNPAYNADRGPVKVVSVRLHTEF
ncbi:MAG: carbohydrate porin, partial [Rhodoferax sp.]|nr:carbohydrate porin [Rhodoferax sp.]